MGKYKEAIVDFTKSIELQKTFVTGYINRGLSHQSLGDDKEALADFDKAIELNPNIATTYSNRADLRTKMGDTAGAAKDKDMAEKAQRKTGETVLLRDYN